MTPQDLWKKALCILCASGCILMSYGQCDREQMVKDYEEHFIGTHVNGSELGWTGDEKLCLSGEISSLATQKTLQRINYYRKLAKVPTEVAFDPKLTKMCQDAAVMMHSNNDLSHSPSESWSCYTDQGKLAAGKSNLALGAHTSAAIALYMIDPGSNNGAVGHRRWILYSRADTFGMGSTSRAHALYVVHTKAPVPENLDYVAYPSAGFFPAPLLPDRWSLSIPNAKFADVEITMFTQSGTEIDLEILEYKSGFGDNTIVWEPDRSSIEKFSPVDQKYRVVVSNIMHKGEEREIEYEVIVAKPEYPPNCKEGFYWSGEECDCLMESTTPSSQLKHGENMLTIQPTLADRHIQITSSELLSGDPVQVQIFDQAGRSMMMQVMHGELYVDTKSYLPGIYTARFKSKSKLYSLRFAVMH